MPELIRRQFLPIWGGVEPTIVRIGNSWRDQVQETGHYDRPDDLERIATLGLQSLRYPVLWERVAPNNPDEEDWSWHDARLGRLRELKLDVIAGLVHHGSGPGYTHLLDPMFPEKLASYAARVAMRYPWLERFTPVNEPLTTARFSALYGYWYPHHTDYRSFLQALMIQCRAVVLAMAAIRTVTPSAQLVQTDDLGRTFSTPLLSYQADFENERRWLSYDLLCGRVGRQHPLRGHLLHHGVTEGDLAFFEEHARPPDIMGMNHYLTSERFLDERVELYPDAHHGGNGRHSYADVEAVRMELPVEDLGPAARLREMWERYRLPVAVTEVHHGATRDEQLRWLVESWSTVRDLLAEGVDVRGFTVWALFGLMDWRSLLMRKDNYYEPGAFDVRSNPPRPTIIAAATQALSRGEAFQHPVLTAPGWWRRPGRHYVAPHHAPDAPPAGRSLLITGGGGTLASVLARFCALRGLDVIAPARAQLDIADPAAVRAFMDFHQPWAVLNAAGRGPDATAADSVAGWRDNVEGLAVLAAICSATDIPLVSFSTAQVFDGGLRRAYNEADAVSPVSAFGKSKAEAERRLLDLHPSALIVRLGHIVETEAMHAPPVLAPAALTYLPDLAHVVLDLLIDGRKGIWHLTHPEDETPHDEDAVCLVSRRGCIMPPARDWLQNLKDVYEHDARKEAV